MTSDMVSYEDLQESAQEDPRAFSTIFSEGFNKDLYRRWPISSCCSEWRAKTIQKRMDIYMPMYENTCSDSGIADKHLKRGSIWFDKKTYRNPPRTIQDHFPLIFHKDLIKNYTDVGPSFPVAQNG